MVDSFRECSAEPGQDIQNQSTTQIFRFIFTDIHMERQFCPDLR